MISKIVALAALLVAPSTASCYPGGFWGEAAAASAASSGYGAAAAAAAAAASGGYGEVKEGFGNQINPCRDRGLSPGPPAQKPDTLPLDQQVTEN
ncbi:unnamed protein product [Timema podura]|uniref:Uncharacterized protein n=1 Tax=Timema podura TaxID=61482 RepID=A0ABN7NF31_TIMPD|nr:unnamed protein product [Timema podura]